MVPDGDVIRTERLDLVLLPGAAMNALIAGQHGRVEAMLGFAVAASFPEEGDLEMLRFRRDQLTATPSWAPWLVRGIVRREDRTMVGLATFHGPPGINDLRAPGAAEVGYTVNKPFRNRGYATESATAMLRWAKQAHGISHFVSGIAPDNLASLRVIHKLGFKPTGLVDDGELIFDLHATRRWPGDSQAAAKSGN
ncbi:MAG: GNAT family N-acetyltransferase [Chloroflexi bacterium]|nr:GNAT family N-acetyltransferase [Chloroflexota bacterium]